MLSKICKLAYEAGDEIIKLYNNIQSIDIAYKSDYSPVTAADIEAHKIITYGLKKISPKIPVISEENPPDWRKRQHWHQYWLIDPLDGTKEFIKRNGEFTVNIALIQYGQPVLGVIYAPEWGVMYSAAQGKAWKEYSDGYRKQIHVRKAYPPLVLLSRSHKENDKSLQKYLHHIGNYKVIEIGSSLKFCLIAEGKAQLYPRFNPINIWDTGAGHAIVIAAGAHVYDWKGEILNYIPRKSFLNFGFHVSLS